MRFGIRWRGLRARILVWSFVPTLAIAATVVAILFQAYDSVVEELVFTRNQEVTRLTAAHMTAEFMEYGDILRNETRLLATIIGEQSAIEAALKDASNRLAIFDGGVLLLDNFGKVTATEPARPEVLGQDWSDHTYFRGMLQSGVSAWSTPIFSDIVADGPGGAEVVVVTVPVISLQGEFLGVMAGMFHVGSTSVSTFYGDIAKLRIASKGSAYLVDSSGRIVYHTNSERIGENYYTQSAVQRVISGEAGAMRTRNASEREIIASFTPVPSTPWGLVIEESWAVVVSSSQGYRYVLLTLLGLGLLLPTLIAAFGLRRIMQPVKDLTQGTKRIAEGDFKHLVNTKTGDEMQDLAEQFNSMADALKQSYASLEQKVEERTRGERRRSEQLRAINEVARKISSILSLDELLPYVVNSLQETFSYYNVNILLLNPGSDDLILRASAGGYKEDIPVGISLKTSQGITGWVAQTGEPLVVNDVSQEPRYLFAAELADTRAELGVPIKIGASTLGVLDIQSTELKAFDELDLFTAQTLADQVAIAVENARLYKETREVAVLEERNRMAREIHDTLAQGFTGIVLQLEAAEQALGEDAYEAHEHIDRARRLARESLNEARRSVWALRPQALEQLSLLATLRQEMERFTQNSGARASFSISGKRRGLPPGIENTLLRICQESLTNVRKHAQASQVEVKLAFERKAVELSIHDNGIGFVPDARGEAAFGLIDMEERARLVGGILTVESEKGKGTSIKVTIPLNGR